MCWIHWLKQNNYFDSDKSKMDELAETIIRKYKLAVKDRKAEMCDMRQFFFKWWNENRLCFNKYDTKLSIGGLCNVDHATVIHYLKNRTPSYYYEINIEEIKHYANERKNNIENN